MFAAGRETVETELARIEGEIQLGEEVVVASGKPERQITFTFGRPDVPSNNRDLIPREEIEKVTDRLLSQGIDLQHVAGRTIGAFASAIRFVPDAKGEFCAGDGKLWTWRYPEEVQAVSDAHAKGLLAGSWVMGFGDAVCTECGEHFGPNQSYPALFKHLREKHGGRGNRTLYDLDPRGAAILLKNQDQPGYEGTRVLALAAKTREEVGNMPDPDETPKKPDEGGAGKKDPPAADAGNEVVLAKELGTLTQRFEKLEADHATLTKERDDLLAYRTQREEADAIAAKAPERLSAFTEAVKKALGEGYTIAENVLEKVRAKAGKLADEAWGEFSTDALELLPPAAQPAVARKVGGSNDPAPTGATNQPDDNPKHAMPKLHAALVGEIEEED